MIKEDFLHYLWQFKLFDFSNLRTTDNEEIIIINSGTHNHNSGPDFFNAQLKINGQLWAGNVEIHIKSSDWFVHHHETDKAYDSVVLHVVWEDDMPIVRQDNTTIPCVVLKSYLPTKLWLNYQQLFVKKQQWINCENSISLIDNFTLTNWKERLYIERLDQKSTQITSLLTLSNNDWEAVLFKMLAKNFGLKVNGDAFLNLASSFDFSVLRKCQSSVEKMEALLFGQSNLLSNDMEVPYYNDLQKEYQFLQQKHQLKPIGATEVKFFRLRPANFPTIRISQLASLYTAHQNLFSKLLAVNSIQDFYDLLQIDASLFWDSHYSFKSVSAKRRKKLTKSFIDLMLINTIIPLRFVYQKHIGKEDNIQLLSFIQGLKSEKNNIIDKFSSLKIESKSAMDSQALLQLKNEYCTKQRCLSCVIGNNLIRKKT